MEWLDKLSDNELKHWLLNTVIPMCSVSLVDGRILWCNASMEKLTGYSKPELQSSKCSWNFLTEDGDDVQAESALIDAMKLKQRTDFTVQKAIRRKAGTSCKVIAHSLRNLCEGENDAILVSVMPLDVVYEYTFAELQEVRRTQAALVTTLNTVVQDLQKPKPNIFQQWWSQFIAHPFLTAAATLFVLAFFFGDRVVVIAQSIVQALGGASPIQTPGP